MEDVGAVFVHVDPFNLFTVDISCDVVALVDDKACFSFFLCFIGEDRAEEAGADDEVVVFHNWSPYQHIHSVFFNLSNSPKISDARLLLHKEFL